MEERKQKTNGICPREDRLEAEVIEGAQTYMEITEGYPCLMDYYVRLHVR